MKKYIGYFFSASIACLCAQPLLTTLPAVAQSSEQFDMSRLEGEWALEGEACANRKFVIGTPDLYQVVESGEITYDGRYVATEIGFNLAEVQYTQPGFYSESDTYEIAEISDEQFSFIVYFPGASRTFEPHGPFTLVRCS